MTTEVITPERPMLCPYCGCRAKFASSSERFYGGRNFGPLYYCDPCDARVGCHPDSTRPLGRLANAELRRAKMDVHEVFDPLWQKVEDAYPNDRIRPGGPPRKFLAAIMRRRAYAWLATHLQITVDDCHIGMFDVAQCRSVVELIRSASPTPTTIRAWAKAQTTPEVAV